MSWRTSLSPNFIPLWAWSSLMRVGWEMRETHHFLKFKLWNFSLKIPLIPLLVSFHFVVLSSYWCYLWSLREWGEMGKAWVMFWTLFQPARSQPFGPATQPSGRSARVVGPIWPSRPDGLGNRPDRRPVGLTVRTDPRPSGRSRQILPRFEWLMIWMQEMFG